MLPFEMVTRGVRRRGGAADHAVDLRRARRREVLQGDGEVRSGAAPLTLTSITQTFVGFVGESDEA